MSSEVDICNLALSHLGDSANLSSLDEGSRQAELCRQFYPIARDALLEVHAWKFATRRKALTLLDTDYRGWAFAYAEPNGCLRMLAVLQADASSEAKGENFDTESQDDGTRIVLTNVEDAELRYTARVSDTSKFSPLFVSCLARLLASYLAGPLIKGKEGIAESKAQYQAFMIEKAAATGSDSNQHQVQPEHKPAWISSR